jgi:hypothetical protein
MLQVITDEDPSTGCFVTTFKGAAMYKLLEALSVTLRVNGYLVLDALVVGRGKEKLEAHYHLDI